MKQKLLDILNNKPSMVNLSRTIKAKDKDLYDWVMSNPPNYPDGTSFNERVYGIENNLEVIPKDENNKNRRFINYFSGYCGLCNLEPTIENILSFKDMAIKNTHGFKKKYRVLYDAIFHHTKHFREDTAFNERLYCLVNNIDQKPNMFINYYKGYDDQSSFISKEEKNLKKQKLEQEYLRLANRTNSNDIKHGKHLYLYREKHIKFHQELYDMDESRKDIDYLVEPILNIRCTMIRSNYIENILKMDVNEYEKLYPGLRGRCQASKDRIIEKLHIPDENGITPYQKSSFIREEKMREVGEDGLTGYERKGAKTRNTHMSKIDEDGRNGYQRLAKYRTETICSNGKTIQENADIKRNHKMMENKNSYTRASAISKTVLKPILDYFIEKDLQYNFDEHEYAIYSTELNKYFLYDLVCSKLKIAIEYQSYVYHSDPNSTLEEWNNWRGIYNGLTSKEIHDADIQKARELYKNRGYITFWVWEKSHKEDVAFIIEYLKTME